MKKIYTAGLTDVGRKRELNEDSFFIDNALACYCIADGMGGHDAGEVASQEAIRVIQQKLTEHFPDYQTFISELFSHTTVDNNTLTNLTNPAFSIIQNAVNYANRSIHQANLKKGNINSAGMGTTIVGTWICMELDEAIIYHIGDSRLYLYRDRQLAQITNDHSLHQFWLDNGKVGPEPSHNIILSALGLTETVETDIRHLSLQANDLLLLCSDGLNDLLSDREIQIFLTQATNNNLQSTCQAMIDLANTKGGFDNITVILVFLM